MIDVPRAIPNSPECSEAAEKAHQIIVSKLNEKGITLDYLADKLKEELEAQEVKVFHTDRVTVDLEGKKITSDEVIYSDPLIAWKVRQEARKDAHKLRGDYPQGEVNLDERPILVVMPKQKKGEPKE